MKHSNFIQNRSFLTFPRLTIPKRYLIIKRYEYIGAIVILMIARFFIAFAHHGRRFLSWLRIVN